MPTYNYYCKKCDKKFTYFQKMSEGAKSTCENCNGKINRVITGGTGLIFKGSGFYLTDYKDNNKVDSKDANSNIKNESKKTNNSKSKTKGKKEKK